MLKKSLRRFKKNETAWTTSKPTTITAHFRNESSRSKTIRATTLHNIAGSNRKSFTLRSSVSHCKETQLAKQRNTAQATATRSIHTTANTPNGKRISLRNKLADFVDFLKDEYRRLTQPENYDPYVQVMLKPTVAGMEQAFKTSVIYGGGSNVAWNEIADDNQYTFLLRNDAEVLNSKYLKIEVFDYESGSADKSLGVASIVTNGLQLGIQHYAVLDLYENSIDTAYAWAGTVEISATFKKLTLFEVEEITAKINEDIVGKYDVNVTHGHNHTMQKRRTRSRGMTDQLILGRHGTRGKLNEELQQKEQKQHDAEAEHVDSVRGRVIDLVLFLSLVLSGTLFFGAMDLHEVDLQTIFYRQHYGTTFSVIDSLHWSLVTASTIGYGDFYPQTTGGKIFASCFIVFGVSLLGRLLNFILEYENNKFEQERKRRATFRKSMTWGQMVEWDLDNDGSISSYEFLRGMLLRREDTTEEFINEIMKIFDEYDIDGSGEIEIDELKEIMAQKAQKMQQQIKDEKTNKDKDKNNKYCNFWCTCFKAKMQPDNEETVEVELAKVTGNDDNICTDHHKMENNEAGFYTVDEFADNEPFEYGLLLEIHAVDNLKQEHEEFEDSLKSFLKSIFGFVAYLIFAAMIFSLVEDADFGDMLWFCVVTACTVGYGDQHPASALGRVLNAFFIGSSVVLFVGFFGTAFDFIYKRQELLMNKKQKIKNDVNKMIDNFHFETLKSVLQKEHKNVEERKDNKTKKANKSRLQVILDDVGEKEDNHQILWDVLNSPSPKEKVDLGKLNTMKSSRNLNLSIGENEFEVDEDHNEYMPSVETGNDEKKVYINDKLDNKQKASFSDDNVDGNEATNLLVTTMESIISDNAKTQKGYKPVQTNDNANEYMD